ncbi:MAG: hypothetical protein AAFX06_17395 [Planctomycetota bacterium]
MNTQGAEVNAHRSRTSVQRLHTSVYSLAIGALLTCVATNASGQAPPKATKALSISPAQIQVFSSALKQAKEAKAEIQVGNQAAAGVPVPTPQAAGGTPAAVEKPDAETQKILDTLKTLSRDEQIAMVEYYKDLGLDLAKWLESGNGSQPARRRQLLRAMRAVKFVRRPEDVLRARSEIGLEPQSLPPPDASDQEIVKWFHRHVMAAEWAAVKALLVMRAGPEAESMYAAMIQGTNHSESELIPEDVLGLSESAPGELTDWQVDSLAGLLKSAAKKTRTEPLIALFREGTTWFGNKDEDQRARTARLLLKADLPIQAYEFMPSLDEAREAKDGKIMKGHAEYFLARATEAKGAASDRMTERAWSLLGETALLDEVETSVRSECLSRAVDLLPNVPPGPGLTWLRNLFQNPSLAPAGLQAVALKALKLEDSKLPEATRAQAILTMKEAVDTLLAQKELQSDQLAIPLRMLTIGLLARAEKAIKEQSGKRGVSEVAALLLRSMPDEAWRERIEPSLVGRAYKAFLGVALIADETDLALDLLKQGAERQPEMTTELANSFLQLWVARMKARSANPMPSNSYFLYSFSRSNRPSAPITRGWQQRNLDRLADLLVLLDEIGIDGRGLPGVVPALSACYGPTEAYDRETIVRVLGPIDAIRSPVALSLASKMRGGLSGDWRSRKAQEDAGFERSDSEVRKIVESGYDLATELAQAAVSNSEEEQDAWESAILKAALSFDRMQFRGEREQDAAAYHAAQRLVFAAFEDAASQYRGALAKGQVRPDMQIYSVWFSLALGASDLGALTLEDLMTDGVENADQVDRLREDILKMDSPQANYHFGEFARAVVSGLSGTKPEVKPRLLQAAARVVGDHPAGAPIRRTLDLYQELVEDELHLRLSIDGSDRIGMEPFGAILTLQHTASIDRSSGGFARYLMDNYSQFSGGQWTTINYQQRLRNSIEESFGDSVELLGIGFFQPMNPAIPIQVEGKGGWQEKPLAYLALQAKDPSVDRLPEIQMDMHFTDASGPIVLPVLSNTVLVDASTDAAPRPVKDLAIEQTLDARPMLEGKSEPTVKLEIVARSAGVVPDLERLFPDLKDALPGYQLDETELVSDPIDVNQIHRKQPEEDKTKTKTNGNPFLYQDTVPNLDPDSDGLFRLGTMRKWTVTYKPKSSVASDPDRFLFPDMDESAFQMLVSMADDSEKDGEDTTAAAEDATTEQLATDSIKRFHYEDYDLVPVEQAELVFNEANASVTPWVIGGLAALLLGSIAVWQIQRTSSASQSHDSAFVVPETLTPTGAALMLRQIESTTALDWSRDDRLALRSDIDSIQQQHFADHVDEQAVAANQNGALRATVIQWVTRASS